MALNSFQHSTVSSLNRKVVSHHFVGTIVVAYHLFSFYELPYVPAFLVFPQILTIFQSCHLLEQF